MTQDPPRTFYMARLKFLEDEWKTLSRRKAMLAWARLFSFLSAAAALWLLIPQGWLPAVLVTIGMLSVFIFFVFRDLANSAAIENNAQLRKINENEIAALDHRYMEFPDGLDLKPASHSYAEDLDIFGRASLYQYANRTTSQQGNRLFANWLLQPAQATEIIQRQQAVKELATHAAWRQQLQALGQKKILTTRTQENIEYWLAEPNQFSTKKSWKVVRIIFPLVSFTLLAIYIAGIIPQQTFLPLILLMLIISQWISRLIMPAYSKLNKVVDELETFSTSIGLVEKTSFNSPLLIELKKTYDKQGNTASQTINQLKKILARLDYRLNPLVYIPLSAFLCWDLLQAFSLEKWKTKNHTTIPGWFSSLAQIESLASLANLAFNHPGWCFPELILERSVFKADTLGHPLIPPAKRVDNSFSTAGEGQVNLITGSNMAGKSTFLRSVGVNMVLAMCGAPVCAKQLSMSHMKVMSSMRISDNLEESTSTFYAELKKLKDIIEAVTRMEEIFLLLDEILRGTNSADRHTGSTALLKQLIKLHASGLVATHDLELAKLSNEFPQNIHNYHFDVQVANDELYFDYKLKGGVCSSMNASILMKKIGIEL